MTFERGIIAATMVIAIFVIYSIIDAIFGLYSNSFFERDKDFEERMSYTVAYLIWAIITLIDGPNAMRSNRALYIHVPIFWFVLPFTMMILTPAFPAWIALASGVYLLIATIITIALSIWMTKKNIL